jgi:hypothetical protein
MTRAGIGLPLSAVATQYAGLPTSSNVTILLSGGERHIKQSGSDLREPVGP